ncbi:DICT sensory domain-containing protein [Fischerella sp. JS2]|uniref:DICT sensory domain-containing protein n=1 Tax=Fischerella sp. JS2 TaxID=2597771 RepID=UPI0028E611AD|nr:DICT sensory domain-containing protein [Fischerella sp. JS2]
MNVSLVRELSIYQLALDVQTPPSVSSVTPANLLSLLKSQIDLLIEQQIPATLWVKLPPGKIWHSEIQRYQQRIDNAGVVYHCHVGEVGIEGVDKENLKPYSPSQQGLRFLPNQKRREYFLIVLSVNFCSLIVTERAIKNHKTLLTIFTFDPKIIQQVLDSIKQAIVPEDSAITPDHSICASVSEPALMSQLLTKQLQCQEEINRQIIAKRIAKIEQQKQALHNSLQLKDEFLSNVCHELRTPLTHMKTALSLLNSPNLKNPQRQRYSQMLSTQCDRQNSLIHGVLELVQIERNLEAMNLEAVCLADIVPGVVSTYQPLAQEKGIMLAYTVPTELPAVWCVSGGLRQIVIHLLSNSIKYTPNGGQVWVWGRLQGDYVQLEFRDSGIGISESEIPKIFDRFYRVRPLPSEDPGGAGLGLTIVQQLLRGCGGSISVKSKPSEGSTFTVQLAAVVEKYSK